jgi:hypothetical protein
MSEIGVWHSHLPLAPDDQLVCQQEAAQTGTGYYEGCMLFDKGFIQV